MSVWPVSGLSLYNLTRPEILAHPYPFYHRLRCEEPVRWDTEIGAWVLTRYADVVSILGDPRCSAARMGDSASSDSIARAFSAQILFQDPPDHTRLRKLLVRGFTPRRVEALRTMIQQLVDRLLDKVQAEGQIDVIRDLANPLPVTVIAQMLGVPEEDGRRLKRWSDDFAVLLGSLGLAEAQAAAAWQRVGEMMAYLAGIVRQRRQQPGPDLLSAWIAAEKPGDGLSAEELIANATLMFAAGHETTTNLIGNGLLALLRHPDERSRLQDEPALIGDAVEELLRYDSPIQLTDRIAREALEIDGQSIEPGQSVFLVLGAANRDPAQFPEPDRLDLGRRDNRHVAFGYGSHFCLGAALARLEGQIALTTLLRRFPMLRLATKCLEWRPLQVVRGLQSLPVVF